VAILEEIYKQKLLDDDNNGEINVKAGDNNRVIHCLVVRKIQNVDIWKMMIKRIIKLMNQNKLSFKHIA